MRKHTIDHILKPGLCTCQIQDMEQCVLCGKPKEQWEADGARDICSFECLDKVLNLRELVKGESS